MSEIWKDIEGYQGHYVISNKGVIKSLDKKVINKKGYIQSFNGRVRKAFLSENGYYRIRLSKGSLVKYYAVHRLVAMAFVYNKEDKQYINHLDGVKINNVASNLEWCTDSENKKRDLSR